MIDIQFIYDTKESKYNNLECYSLYDPKMKETIYDTNLEKSMVAIDRRNKLIYFLHMETEEHWILEKNFYFKIIENFLKDAKYYDCENYTVFKDCSGGQIYYKYN